MRIILKISFAIILAINYLNTFAWTWDVYVIEKNIQTSDGEVNIAENKVDKINIEDELKKDWIELEAAPVKKDEDKSIVDRANDIKNKELDKLMWKTDEEKNIEAIQTVLTELDIKKELNQSQLWEIQTNLKVLQKNIEENNKNISILKEWKKVREISKQLEDIEKENDKLLEELRFKEELISDLQDSIAWYNILEAKYKNVLKTYIDDKKIKENSILQWKEQKLVTLFISIIIFIIAYIIKILLISNTKFLKKHENFWEYFNLLFWIVLTIFMIGYVFYLFPELYALLIFISWSLIFINAQVISSFVASIILFRNFKIWDVIKIWTEKWKIIKITTLSTIIKRINDYWVLENEEINIPNIDLLKEKVTLAKNILIKENVFNIILALNWGKNLFEIIDYIKEKILLKMLKEKLNTLNPLSTDNFKTKYEHTDSDKIKVTFYWLWSSELNRRIERQIIEYIKEFSIKTSDNCDENNESCKTTRKKHESLKKASIIQEEVDS